MRARLPEHITGRLLPLNGTGERREAIDDDLLQRFLHDRVDGEDRGRHSSWDPLLNLPCMWVGWYSMREWQCT